MHLLHQPKVRKKMSEIASVNPFGWNEKFFLSSCGDQKMISYGLSHFSMWILLQCKLIVLIPVFRISNKRYALKNDKIQTTQECHFQHTSYCFSQSSLVVDQQFMYAVTVILEKPQNFFDTLESASRRMRPWKNLNTFEHPFVPLY